MSRSLRTGIILKQPIQSAERHRLRELTGFALLAALLIVSKEAMQFLPNIEPVTLLLLLAAERYGWKALYPTYVFVLVEGLLYGFHLWFFSYLYVWAIWVALVIALRRFSHPLLWAILAGLFGLLFGTLCSLPYWIIGGAAAAVSWIIAGLSFDLVHAAGNLVIVGILYLPLSTALKKLPQ